MILASQRDRLKSNWNRAESMACKAEMRIYDPLSDWQCYILAMDPDDDDKIICIISTNRWADPILTDWTISELKALYNSDGESAEIDTEFRPREAAELFKLLNREVSR